ncbi:MAG: hypothetical protein HZA46_07390 [Planctomycetales bacterium]|nr:hypothetical protein [Planctomycetales bacterium]
MAAPLGEMLPCKTVGGLEMVLGKWQIPFCIAACLLAGGCDPVRTTAQRVRFQVTNSDSGKPVEDAIVSVKFDFGHDHPPPQEPEGTEAELKYQQDRKSWQDYSWSVSTTDASGLADIDLIYDVIDRTSGSIPPSSRDEVTGQPYLVKVREGQLPEEELNAAMKPSASIKGNRYTVTIVDIERPRYVEGSQWRQEIIREIGRPKDRNSADAKGKKGEERKQAVSQPSDP